MQKLFAQTILLGAVGLIIGCQSDGAASRPTNGHHQEQALFSDLSQNVVAASEIGKSGLIAPDRARQTLKDFKDAYLKLGSPRFLIYANHDAFERSDDIEQAFAKPLRIAGATVAEQKEANAMMAGKWLKAPGPADDAKASRDRDSLRKIADVGIEILMAAQGSTVGSSRVDLQACKLEYSIVSPK